jgi:predicted DNA-binding protein
MLSGVYIIHTMKRVNYHLTGEQIGRLQFLSGKTGLTVAEIIRRAVDEYLDKRKVPLNLEENLKKGGRKRSE